MTAAAQRRVLGHITVPYTDRHGFPDGAIRQQIVAVALGVRRAPADDEYAPTGLSADAPDADIIAFAWARAAADTATLRHGDAVAVASRAMTRVSGDLALVGGELHVRRPSARPE